ncbi:hypothetical protein ACRCOO_00745 [Streptococcus uberis]|uniref:hypothetical protein n=1 Tax=Streptococcus uberis TaxID=1349 RepID=UPI003D6B2C2A
MKNIFWTWLNSILLGLLVGMMFTCGNVNNENKQLKQRNNHLKSELKVKTKQIDGLHEQLGRTQRQLKKATNQNIEQTQKIAELTGNGG